MELSANVGWGAGNNAAIPVALAEGAEHLIFLNMDTVLDRRWLVSLVDAADRRPETQILQSKILLHGTTGRVNSVGSRIQFLGYASCAGFGQDDRPSWPTEPDAASGASMLVKRAVFERIGVFQDDYFMYYDDVEFCWRARLAGLRVGLAEQSICYHKYDPANARRLLYYLERNRLLTLLALERVPSLLLISPCVVLAESVMTVYCLMHGLGRMRWRLIRCFLRRSTWRGIVAQRRRVRALRARRDAEVVRRFAGPVFVTAIDSRPLRWLANPVLSAYWAIVRHLIVW